jgi:hypothetical protein
MKRIKQVLPLALISMFLFTHLALINDYGLTWDFHHHFFAGAYFLGYLPEQIEPRPLPYTVPDPRLTLNLPYGPFVQIIPTLSYLLFHEAVPLLPADSAYNLPIILAGVAGIAVLLYFMKEAFGWIEGIVASLFLFFTPRFFSDLHNDMKDVPSASVFALNMWLLYRLVRYRRIKDMILASIGFALAFNTKINAIFIPIIFAAFLALVFIQKHCACAGSVKNCLQNIKRVTRAWQPACRQAGTRLLLLAYFLLAPLLAFLLWMAFWRDSIGHMQGWFETFGTGTNNIEVLLHGTIYCSGYNVPWYYAPWYLTITTPVPILILFFVGTVVCLKNVLVKKQPAPLLLFLWLTLPLIRYLSPKIGVIDGIRHFEEVVFPIAAIAGIGAVSTARWFLRTPLLTKKIRGLIIAGAGTLVLSVLAVTILRYHPFEITYFNELVGGNRGAWGNYDLDYWGGSQKHAIEWINANARPNAVVNIVMAADVAGTYLRPDLIRRLNTTNFMNADYVVILNRQGFFYRYGVEQYLIDHNPVHTISNQGVPLVWIYDARMPQVPAKPRWWKRGDPCMLGGMIGI